MGNYSSEIVICHVCKGSGRRLQKVCVDYHRRDYNIVDEGPCGECTGTGRMRKITEITWETI